MGIDTSDWSIVVIDIGGEIITDCTLHSEKEWRMFCDMLGYRFIRFEKGTNKLCT